jgi:hypothetical protein
VFLWPIKDAKTGENILYKPQDYIRNEFNLGNLIIHAPKGSLVQAPTSGEVISFQYVYHNSLAYLNMFRIPPTNFDKDSKILIQQGWNDSEDINFVSASLGLKLQDGRTIYISGLRPIKPFKTGEKIKRGDEIGTIGYFYKTIRQPAISIRMSERGGIVGDPMSPFGLKSTFRKPEMVKNKTFLTAEEAKYDLMVLVDALKDGFTGLYDYVSEKDFEAHVSQALTSVQNGITNADFHTTVAGIIRIVHDNHLAILSRPIPSSPPATSADMPTVSFGWLKDSLVVTQTRMNQSEYLKRRITEVDGIPADVLREQLISYIDGIEGTVESHRDFVLATTAMLRYFQNNPEASPKGDVSLTFDDGETILFEGARRSLSASSGVCVPMAPTFTDFYFANLVDDSQELSLEKFSDQTAYLKLSTFDITEVQQDQIAEFIASLADSNYQNLIIDLRNNRGGSDETMARLFSYIAQQPFYDWMYSKVNKKGNFDFFEHTTNYGGVDMVLFPEHFSEKGRDGYFSYNTKTILPNENANFKGNVYVLTNERSLSASAVFAGLVHKYRRGVVVGRETGSAYHQMKALKFATLRLPNSQIDINVPLVKIVFDTCTSAIPHWRGVLPDYELPLSLEELSFEDGDAILNYVKELIEKGYYLKEIENSETQKKQNWYVRLISIVCCSIVVYLIIRVVNKRKLR